ncbi:MAG: hypothetical protein ABIT96_06310 [Ferruginibacter sp.]
MMNRVKTLVDKLQRELNDKMPASHLLVSAQMLQAELLAVMDMDSSKESDKMISMDVAPSVLPRPQLTEEPLNGDDEEKTVAVLQVDEAEVEAELEEIKKNAESRNKITVQNKPTLVFDPVEDIPTLRHQQPAPAEKQDPEPAVFGQPTASLNDRLRQTQIELSDTLKDTAIKDLKKAIGVNDRFLFINELFRGDEVMYERSIKTINNFSIFPEAEYWIRRELKVKLAWDDKDPVVKQFDQLIIRRFPST